MIIKTDEKQQNFFLILVLQTGLEANFAEVQVSVVECPDLTKDPFQFPVKGTIFLCMLNSS